MTDPTQQAPGPETALVLLVRNLLSELRENPLPGARYAYDVVSRRLPDILLESGRDESAAGGSISRGEHLFRLVQHGAADFEEGFKAGAAARDAEVAALHSLAAHGAVMHHLNRTPILANHDYGSFKECASPVCVANRALLAAEPVSAAPEASVPTEYTGMLSRDGKRVASDGGDWCSNCHHRIAAHERRGCLSCRCQRGFTPEEGGQPDPWRETPEGAQVPEAAAATAAPVDVDRLRRAILLHEHVRPEPTAISLVLRIRPDHLTPYVLADEANAVAAEYARLAAAATPPAETGR